MIKSEHLNNMLASILTGDKENFESSFKSEVSDRIGAKISDRTLDISKDILTGSDSEESVELDEATKWKIGDGRPRGSAHIENVKYWDSSKDQLQYIIKDAGKAMQANPTARKATTGPGNWADQVNDAHTVLGWRKKKGIKESVKLDEGRVGSTYTFKNPSDAKKFVSDTSKTPGLIGVNKKNFSVRGKIVTISGIKDKEMIHMLSMIAQEMKAKIG